MITKSEIMAAIRSLGVANESPELVKRLSEIAAGLGEHDEAVLIDRNQYFASILWQEEDVRSALEERGVDPTEENISLVLSDCDVSEMENCEHGWECIYAAIFRVFGS